MVTSSTRKRKQSQHSSVGNKRTNTKTQSPSTANQVQCNNTTINQQLKLISVTSSSAECSKLPEMSVQNHQHICNMESEIAKLKQQITTLLTQQQQHKQNQQHIPLLSPIQRIATLVHSSLTALNDPTRADAVAAVGEVTGSFALSKMLAGMESNEVGRRILNDRPIVDENIAKQAEILLQQHNDEMSTSNVNFNNPINVERTKGMSFGAAYATFLQTHKFDPNERDSVRFISDPKLSYVMARYRQCHDYWHVLTGLPPTVLGELGLKWLELIQTGLPLAALSATSGVFGANGLRAQEREILISVYLPWAMKVGHNMKEHSLLCTYYEEELETDLDVLRERMGIEPAPKV